MKELSIEEKAKAYDEALEKARQLCAYPTSKPFISDLQDLFPELKESEDERMRRWIINYLDNKALNSGIIQEKTNIKNAIAWLEKQGEQKSIDDLTQQEAMDIAVAKCFEQEEQKPILDIEIPFGAKDSELQKASYHIPEGFHAEIEGNKVVIKKGEQKPAGWKQDNIEELTEFEAAMLHIGESFFGKNHGLNSNDTSVVKEQARLLLEFVANKPAWSEEDEENRKNILYILNQLKGTAIYKEDKTAENCIDWLKSLKDRYTWKPSDEQMKILNEVLNFAANHESSHWNDYIFGTLNNFIRQLKN